MVRIDGELREKASAAPGKPHAFLMQVRVSEPDFSEVPGLEVRTRQKSTWTCLGTKATVEALCKQPDAVVSLTATRLSTR